MPKPRKQTTIFVLERMNRGWKTEDVAREANISNISVARIERGEAISRMVVRSYLQVFGVDLANRQTWPNSIEIIDEGVKVKVISRAQ